MPTFHKRDIRRRLFRPPRTYRIRDWLVPVLVFVACVIAGLIIGFYWATS